MSPEPHEIGARLRAGRNRAGLSQVALAAIIDIDQKMISRWELGAVSPTTIQLVAICRALNIDPGDVLAEVAA